MARIIAAQQFGKVALAGSVPDTINTGGQRYSGNTMIAENTNPQSTEGRMVRDAELASSRGNPAGATAIGRTLTKSGSSPEGVPYPPSGLPTPPVPVRPAAPGLQGVAGRGHTPAEVAGAAHAPTVVAPAGSQAAESDMPSAIATAAGKKAAAEAGAKAEFESGGTMTMQTPWGPQEIPISAATRAKIQPSAQSTSGTPNPSAPGANASFSDRFAASGLRGKPLPNPAVEPLVKVDADELAKDRESALKGQQDMATVRMIQDFLPKVRTGWSAENKLEGARILKGLGVSDEKIGDLLKTDVASGQILQKKFLELSSAAARNMGAREPGSVIQMFAKAYPNLGTDEKAVRLQTNALYMDRLRAQRLAEEKTNHISDSVNEFQQTGQYRGLKGFNEDFNKRHNPETYLSASEAMSGVPQAWQRIKDPRQQQAVADLIPSGSTFMAPDGKMRIKP